MSMKLTDISIRTIEYWKGIEDQLPTLRDWADMKQEPALQKIVQCITQRLKAVLKVWVSVRDLTNPNKWKKLPNKRFGFSLPLHSKQDDLHPAAQAWLSKALQGSEIVIHAASKHSDKLWRTYPDIRKFKVRIPKDLEEMFSDFFIQVMVEVRNALLPYLDDDPEYASERKHPLTIEKALKLVEAFRTEMSAVFTPKPVGQGRVNIILATSSQQEDEKVPSFIDPKHPRPIGQAFSEKPETSALIRNLPEDPEIFENKLRTLSSLQRSHVLECLEQRLLHYLPILPRWSEEGEVISIHRERKKIPSLPPQMAKELKHWINAFPATADLENEWLRTTEMFPCFDPKDKPLQQACDSLREEIIAWLTMIRRLKKEFTETSEGVPWVREERKTPEKHLRAPPESRYRPRPKSYQEIKLERLIQEQDRDGKTLEIAELELRAVQGRKPQVSTRIQQQTSALDQANQNGCAMSAYDFQNLQRTLELAILELHQITDQERSLQADIERLNTVIAERLNAIVALRGGQPKPLLPSPQRSPLRVAPRRGRVGHKASS